MLVKEKRKTLVSLPPLSNQERELYKEAGLSAMPTRREQDPPAYRQLWNGKKWPLPVLQVKAFTTKHTKQRKTLEEKKKAKRAASKGKEKKGVVQMWWRREEEKVC